MALTRDQLMQPIPLQPPRRVDAPEFGGELWIRSLDAAEKTKAISLWITKNDKHRQYAQARWISVCFSDADGNRLFRDGDELLIARWPAAVVEKYFELCYDHNAGAAIDLEKKSASCEDVPNDSGNSE